MSLQFHAMPFEIGDLVAGLIEDNDLFMVDIIGNPPHFYERLSPRVELVDSSDRKALIFSISPPIISAKSIYDFKMSNPNALTLTIGSLTSIGLEESWLSSTTNDPVVLRRWRMASKMVRANMLSGSYAIDPATGKSVILKWHRFTKAAQQAFLQGVKILPAGGNSLIMLPSPDTF